MDELYFPYPEYLLPWFDENKRDLPWRKSKDAYSVWVSEIMLQQTRVEAAKEYYTRFLQELPTVFDLAACDDEKLMKLWEGLGYYSRARNLKKCAVQIVEEYGGVFPKEREKLIKLPGIGEYTAGSVSSIAFDEKNPAIDGNVLRVCARAEGDFTPVDNAERRKKLYARLREVYPDRAGDYTQSLMELGALVCLPDTPRCGECPLRGKCVAERDGLQAVLPVMPKKAEKKKTSLAVFVIVTPRGIALEKRAEKGLLAGMWQFPNVAAERVEEYLAELGVTDYKVCGQKTHTHVFTHKIWEMTAYLIETSSGVAAECFPIEKIEREISLPTAFRWGLELLK